MEVLDSDLKYICQLQKCHHSLLQVQRHPPPVPEKVAYWDIEDVKRDLHRIPLPWTVLTTEVPLRIGIIEGTHINTLVVIDSGMTVHVTLDGIPLSKQYSMEKEKIPCLLNRIKSMTSCKGVTTAVLQSLAPLPSQDGMTSYYRHVKCSFRDGHMVHTSTVRSTCCLGLTEGEMCAQCTKAKVLLLRKAQRLDPNKNLPLSSKTPLQKVAKERLVIALKESRKSVRRLKKEKEMIEKRLEKECVPVGENLHKSLKDVIGSQTFTDPFLEMFWAEQNKAFTRQKGGMRWHPMMIRFAILIYSQSPAVYDTLRQTGALKLPGESTLKDYSNAIHPQQGFNMEVIEEVRKASAKLQPHQRWVVLLHDEMAIKSDLVHDQVTGEVVGFVDSSNWAGHSATEEDLATQVLVFMVVGVNSHLKMSLGYFPSKSATSAQLFPIFWRAVGILETQCGLKVAIFIVKVII